MRQTLLVFTVALMILGISETHAQSTIDVVKFTRFDNDLTARVTRPVKDTDKGKHTYKVIAEQFDSQEGDFELNNELVRINATLRPQFGQIELFTLPVEGFDIYLNGENVGKSPYKSERLEPGKYNIRVEKEKFYPIDTILAVERATTSTVTYTLTSFADSLFYNRRLGGRKISIGVQAGYMMPTISTSSGGGFTGSPINYSFSDPTEDADYKSMSGFTVGIFGDFRLYKNLYLMSGINYTNIKYKNAISGTLSNHIVQTTSSSVAQGTTGFSYKEEFLLSTIHILPFENNGSYYIHYGSTQQLLNYGHY